MSKFIALLLALFCSPAMALPPVGAMLCPLSVDGAQITPPAQIGCTLIDHSGNVYLYKGDTGYGLYLLYKNGRSYAYSVAFQLNQGRKPFIYEFAASSTNTSGVNVPIWVDGETNHQAVTPAQGDISNWAKIGAKRYATLGAALGAASRGTTIEVLTMPAGLPIYWQGYAIVTADIAVNCDSPAAIGYKTSPSPLPDQAVFAVDAGNFTLNGCEVTGARDNDGQQRGMLFGRGAHGLTLTHTYFHDNDFGLQSTGSMGTVTLRDTMFDHNGSGRNGSATHNIYLGGDIDDLTNATHLTTSGGYSVCTNHGGFPVKVRGEFGTIQNYVAADVSFHGYMDCDSSGAVDMSCGGVYTLGMPDTGHGAVFEFGPNAENKTALIRFGAEATGVNCTPNVGTAPYPTNTLLVQNAWLLMDAPGNPHVVYNGVASGFTATVQNSKIVCNGTEMCNSTVLGTGPGAANVTDGGRNTYYANRTAAGLAAYPALPAVP